MPLLMTAAALMSAAPMELKNFTPAACEEPATRTAILESNASEPLFIAAMKQRSSENERKVDALMARLAVRARLTDEQRAQVALDLLKAPGFEAAMKEGFAIVEEMLSDLGKVTRNKDERANCLTVVSMLAKLPAIEATADKQWRIMEGALQAEAQRRGVSLDP